MASKIVSARYIVTGMNDQYLPQVVENGAVLSHGGVIQAVGDLEQMQKLAPRAEITLYPNHVMLPGFVNAHHHIGLTPLQAGSPDLPLELWIGCRLLERRADAYLDTLYSAFEMIASGITTVAHVNGAIPGAYENIHATSTKVLNAYRAIGMRASFSVMARDQNRLVYEADEAFCARLPHDLGQALARELHDHTTSIADSIQLFDQLAAENEAEQLTRIQLAPANLHWCSDDALLALFEKSESANTPMHMHLLETVYQKEYARRRSNGVTAIKHLHNLGILGPKMTLGHGVWVTEEDIEIAASTGTCVCHNCSSNFRLRSGVAPLNAYARKGVNLALGIDEAGINDDRDMLQEMRLVLQVHRAPGLEEDDVPSVPQVLQMATEGGAKTTAFGDQIGRLEPARFMDAVLIDWNEAAYPFQHPDVPVLDALVMRAKTGSVKAVYVGAELVYDNGRFTKIDREAVLEEMAEQLRAPPSQADIKRRALSHGIRPYVKDFYQAYLPTPLGQTLR